MEPLVNPVQEGLRAGKVVARRHWDAFLFDGDAAVLLLSKTQAEGFIYRRGGEDGGEIEFRDPGPEEWRQAPKRKYSAWWDAFRRAYKIEIERLINSFIPKAIRGKLNTFCEMVRRIRSGIAGGDATPAESYGVHLGKIVEEEPVALTRARLPKVARRAALQQARADWHRAIHDNYIHGIKWDNFFVESQSSSDARGFDFMPRYADMVKSPSGERYHSPDQAPRAAEDAALEELWHREWKQAYRDYIGKKLRDFMPPLARKRAYWICALHDRLEEVKKERFQRRPSFPPEG